MATSATLTHVDTSISRQTSAKADDVFALAAAVDAWPRILPHYRWVRVLDRRADGRRTVEMAARRDVVGRVGFPLHWTAVQSVHPESRRIEFVHVRGVTRGMRVVWTIEPAAAAVQVTIRHVFEPGWPVPELLVREIVGEYFVNGVARRTLNRICALAEGRTQSRPAGIDA